MKIPKDVKTYVIDRYDNLFSDLTQEKTLRKIRSEVERRFGIKISDGCIRSIFFRSLLDGTHLHNFFDLTISDFKAKYGDIMTKKTPQYLFSEISNFIEKEYVFGGKLNLHERNILSRVLNHREDIVYIGEIKRAISKRGCKSKGRLGYFIT